MNRGKVSPATAEFGTHSSLTRGYVLAPGLLLAGLALIALAVFLLSLAVGSVRIPIDEIVAVLLGGDASKPAWATIVLKFRLPKALTAMLAGAALSVSGLQMQTLFRNPLAGPFVLGISSGASLGVALTVLLAGVAVGLGGSTSLLAGISLAGDTSLALSAIAGSGLVLLLVMSVARKVQSGMTILILGLMFGYTTSALVSVLIYFSVAERIQAYISWTFGSFGGVTWRQLQVMAPAIVLGLAGGHLLMKPLNALLLGETYALSLGLNVRRVRLGDHRLVGGVGRRCHRFLRADWLFGDCSASPVPQSPAHVGSPVAAARGLIHGRHSGPRRGYHRRAAGQSTDLAFECGDGAAGGPGCDLGDPAPAQFTRGLCRLTGV